MVWDMCVILIWCWYDAGETKSPLPHFICNITHIYSATFSNMVQRMCDCAWHVFMYSKQSHPPRNLISNPMDSYKSSCCTNLHSSLRIHLGLWCTVCFYLYSACSTHRLCLHHIEANKQVCWNWVAIYNVLYWSRVFCLLCANVDYEWECHPECSFILNTDEVYFLVLPEDLKANIALIYQENEMWNVIGCTKTLSFILPVLCYRIT